MDIEQLKLEWDNFNEELYNKIKEAKEEAKKKPLPLLEKLIL